MNDAELIVASRDDPARFRELYDRLAEDLLAYFYRRVLDAEVAADLLAETYAVVTAQTRSTRSWQATRSGPTHRLPSGTSCRLAVRRLKRATPICHFASYLRTDCIESVENRAGHRFSDYGPAVTERHLSEIERVLLYVGDAQSRANRAAAALEREDAPAHVVAALADTARRMSEAYAALSQRTYYAVAPGADR